MKGKIFSVDEANRMLPLVSRIVEDIVSTYGQVNSALAAYETVKAAAEIDPSKEPELRARDAAVAELLDQFQALIQEIEALGGTVKDYERGFVDFYGEVDGEIVFLCWQRGEEHIGHWHRTDEGFGKRRPLQVAAPA
jgi:hypothetical protein